jgi:WD40 repeat protein
LPSWDFQWPLNAVASSPDGWTRIWLDYGGQGMIWHAKSRTPTYVDLVAPNLENDWSLAFSPDGKLLAGTSAGGPSIGPYIGLWNAAEVRAGTVYPIHKIEGFKLAPHSVVFSWDGRRLAAGGDGREAVKIYSVESRQELLTLDASAEQGFWGTTFSPDDNVLAASSVDGMLHLWRAPSWREIEAAEARQGNNP